MEKKSDAEAKKLCRRYSMSLLDFRSFEEKGGSQCVGCGDTGKLFVDHDHASGLVRGLLCRRCNMILGLSKDAPSVLNNLSRYLSEAIGFREKVDRVFSEVAVLLRGDEKDGDLF